MELSKMGTVEIIEDADGYTPLDEDLREELATLDIAIVFDFSRQELVFELSDENILVFDFENFSIQKMETQTLQATDTSFINQVPSHYLSLIHRLSQELKGEVFIFGEGFYQYLAIRMYQNEYIVIGQILIDIGDFVPPDDDPDGGEPLPDVEVGDFYLTKNKKQL